VYGTRERSCEDGNQKKKLEFVKLLANVSEYTEQRNRTQQKAVERATM
jgi:hypothetical protein